MLECSSRSLNIQLTYVNYLKYICESEFDLRESPDWLSQKKEGKPGTCRRTVPFLAHVVMSCDGVYRLLCSFKGTFVCTAHKSEH
jgi:hypothetical protein